MSTTRSLTIAGTVSAVLIAAGALPVMAAPEFADGGVVEAGQGRQVVTIQNRFGCEGEATERFEVTIPEGVIDVTPKATAGWTIERESVPSDPYELFGSTQTERTGLVRWTGSVNDDEFAEFSFMALFGDAPTTYAFPVVQVCAGGQEVAWTETAEDGQDPADLERPAPLLQVVEPTPEVDLVALSDTVTQLSEDSAALEERVAALETTLGEVVNEDGEVRVPALRQQVTGLREALDALEQRIETLEGGATPRPRDVRPSVLGVSRGGREAAERRLTGLPAHRRH